MQKLSENRINIYLDVIDEESRNTNDTTDVITKNIKSCTHLLALVSPNTQGVIPRAIANQTKLGMTRPEVEQVYAGKQYHYQDNLPIFTIEYDNNILLPKQPIMDEATKSRIKNHMVVWTGIDTIFIVGFDKNDIVIFTSRGDTQKLLVKS